ncbi:hypothetical protein CHELA40_14562 [Chelatococcus asaccharovorans]|nr:hypothetical protein CHELA17_61057 [Chelatococcus asaccharovorans]CAH1678400.1 hypothetical protein CHELA40_14562 [Chelatococcus asaccharovorans]
MTPWASSRRSSSRRFLSARDGEAYPSNLLAHPVFADAAILGAEIEGRLSKDAIVAASYVTELRGATTSQAVLAGLRVNWRSRLAPSGDRRRSPGGCSQHAGSRQHGSLPLIADRIPVSICYRQRASWVAPVSFPGRRLSAATAEGNDQGPS